MSMPVAKAPTYITCRRSTQPLAGEAKLAVAPGLPMHDCPNSPRKLSEGMKAKAPKPKAGIFSLIAVHSYGPPSFQFSGQTCQV